MADSYSSDGQLSPVEKIEELLKAKDDTSRFVGLALLKSTLDNSDEIRSNEDVILRLWNSISPRFIDRLLRTGSKPNAKQGDAREMLDLAVAILFTFSLLLPEDLRSDPKLLARVGTLVEAVVQSSEESAEMILKTLLTLVSSSVAGATAFAAIEDISALIEVALKQPIVLDILAWAWIYGRPTEPELMRSKIHDGISALTASYKNTDGVTLLDFVGRLLSRLDQTRVPVRPTWIKKIVGFVQSLITSKPNAASRQAYTNCSANLLVTYPKEAGSALFDRSANSSKPFSYLFINLLLIDIRSSLPTLLEKLNTPDYPIVSERLTSNLIILSFFVKLLIEWIESFNEDTSEAMELPLPAEQLLKLHDGLAETFSVLLEYLRDRWDAAVAGAQGLHPEARAGLSYTSAGVFKTLTWDAKTESVSEDRFLLASLRVLGDWLRDDDRTSLRMEATGLMDMLMDLYETKTTGSVELMTRPLVLGVLDGVLKIDEGVESLLEHNGWAVLEKDLLRILSAAHVSSPLAYEVGQHIVAILEQLAETRAHTPEDWLDIVTRLAAYQLPASEPPPGLQLQQLWADALRLTTQLLVNAPPGVKRRYVHTAKALAGIISSIAEFDLDDGVKKELEDTRNVLDGDSVVGQPSS